MHTTLHYVGIKFCKYKSSGLLDKGILNSVKLTSRKYGVKRPFYGTGKIIYL